MVVFSRLDRAMEMLPSLTRVLHIVLTAHPYGGLCLADALVCLFKYLFIYFYIPIFIYVFIYLSTYIFLLFI